MYEIGQRVYVKSQRVVATVSERNFIGKPRRASYLVEWHPQDGHNVDFLTGSTDLRAADARCDGCSRWLPFSSYVGGATSPDDMGFCFLCVQEAKRNGEY